MRLVAHRVFTPTPGDPIDFEATVERRCWTGASAYVLRQVLFDPFQMAAVAQRLAKAHRADRGISADGPEPDGERRRTCST